MFEYSRNVDECRDALMRMWKDVFHDSKEYISLFFDSYFNRDNCRVVMERGTVISMMFAVPYKFNVYGEKYVNGLYLCGLATDKKYRGRGIMRRMIEDVNRYAGHNGYEFTFLIPAGDSLRRYYGMTGYVNNIDRSVWLPKHVDDKDCISGYYCSNYCKIEDVSNVHCLRLISFLVEREQLGECVNIVHSARDWQTVIQEWVMSGGFVVEVTNIRDRSEKCVAFVRIENDAAVVSSYFSNSYDNVHFLLSWLKNHSQCEYIKVYDYPERAEKIASLISLELHQEHYGMCRFLCDSENLKFPSDCMAVRKNQNLTKFSERGEILKSGECVPQIGISMMLD